MTPAPAPAPASAPGLAQRLAACRTAPAGAAPAPLADPGPDLRPADAAAGYAVAAELARLLEPAWGPVVGWKIGATGARGQQALGLAEPFFGRLFRDRVRAVPDDGPSVSWDGGGRAVTLDAEIVFAMAATPAPGLDLPALKTCVAALHLGVEVNQPAWADPFALGGPSIIADNGANAGLVLGPALPPGTDLTVIAARLLVGGEERMAGTGALVLGDPWNALAWLVGALDRQGLALRPWDLVASGNIAFAQAEPGQAVAADFGPAGRIVLHVGGGTAQA